MAYGDFKDLTRITASDKILCDKAFNIVKNPKYDGYQCGFTSIIHKFFDKKNLWQCGITNENNSNKESAVLHKPITR